MAIARPTAEAALFTAMNTPATAATAPPPSPLIIGFRLDDESRRILSERAARLGVSVHALARSYVNEALHVREERAILTRSLQTIEERLTLIRGDVATTAEVMLTNAGKVEPKEAHRWVEEVFR